MMMGMEMQMETPRSSSNNKTCVNCCAPLCHSNIHHDDHNNIEPSFSQILSSSFNPTNNGTKYLYSIFKLNYLKAFEALDWEVEEDENEVEQLILLCTNCNDVLTNLYQLYEAFLQLGKRESSLSKKLTRLDEIIDYQSQKTINCDLIPTFKSTNNNLVDSFDNNSVPDLLTKKQSSSLNSQPTLRQPLLVLTRLPESSLKLRTTTTADDDDDFNSPSSANSDDDDDYVPLSPLAQMEVDGHEDEIEILSKIKAESVEDIVITSEEDEITLKNRIVKSNSNIESSKGPGRVSGSGTRRPRGKTRKRKNMGWSTKSIMESTSKKKSKHKDSNKNRSKSYSTKEDFIPCCKRTRHYVAIKSKYPNPCWYCDRTDFATPADCLEHTTKEHLPKVDNSDCQPIRVCERCSKICRGSDPVHLRKCLLIPSGSVVERKFQCTLCSHCSLRKTDLKNHMATHTDDRPYSCDLCDYTAKTYAALYSHKKKMHDNVGKERVTCDECQKSFKTVEILKAHKVSMHTVEGHKKYREREEIMSARRKQARQMRTLSTICEDCNIDLFSRLRYCNHRRTIHGDPMSESTCETCGQPFTTRKALLEHTKTVHSDARPFVCETCGKSFKRGYNLKSHIEQTHTEEGRIKYNEKTREKNRRRKMLNLQLANAGIVQEGGQRGGGQLSNSDY